ncbi:unnamed protein product, partial [Polarella glacialis]
PRDARAAQARAAGSGVFGGALVAEAAAAADGFPPRPRGAAQLLGGIGERAVWLVGGFQGLGRRLVRAAALGGPLCQLLPGGGQHQTAALLPGVSLQGEPGAAGELRWRVLSPAEGPGRWTLGGWHPGPPAAWHLRGG